MALDEKTLQEKSNALIKIIAADYYRDPLSSRTVFDELLLPRMLEIQDELEKITNPKEQKEVLTYLFESSEDFVKLVSKLDNKLKEKRAIFAFLALLYRQGPVDIEDERQKLQKIIAKKLNGRLIVQPSIFSLADVDYYSVTQLSNWVSALFGPIWLVCDAVQKTAFTVSNLYTGEYKKRCEVLAWALANAILKDKHLLGYDDGGRWQGAYHYGSGVRHVYKFNILRETEMCSLSVEGCWERNIYGAPLLDDAGKCIGFQYETEESGGIQNIKFDEFSRIIGKDKTTELFKALEGAVEIPESTVNYLTYFLDDILLVTFLRGHSYYTACCHSDYKDMKAVKQTVMESIGSISTPHIRLQSYLSALNEKKFVCKLFDTERHDLGIIYPLIQSSNQLKHNRTNQGTRKNIRQAISLTLEECFKNLVGKNVYQEKNKNVARILDSYYKNIRCKKGWINQSFLKPSDARSNVIPADETTNVEMMKLKRQVPGC